MRPLVHITTLFLITLLGSACAHQPQVKKVSAKKKASAVRPNAKHHIEIKRELKQLQKSSRAADRAQLPLPTPPSVTAEFSRLKSGSKPQSTDASLRLNDQLRRASDEKLKDPVLPKLLPPKKSSPPPAEPGSELDDFAAENLFIDEAKKNLASETTPVLINPEFSGGEIARSGSVTLVPAGPLKRLNNFTGENVEISSPTETPLIFELPITYNHRVKKWIQYFQTTGRVSFRRWLERSTRWLPYIYNELEAARLPQDLIYVAMIESGFSPEAVSPARAVGMWQFIRPTGQRYGLRTNWWLDERRDVYKSTRAAISYIRDLYKMFGSWYLVAASYNMGENGVKRLIRRHGTNDFWDLADRGVLPEETKNYVPKILAAMLISKAPALYGFRDLQHELPHSFDYFHAPAGTDLNNLAAHLGVSARYLRELNPELIRGFIPLGVPNHKIRIPKGSMTTVAQFVKMRTDQTSF